MSLQSWKEEFYPVEAESAHAQRTNRRRLENTILKWRGTLPSALKKHGVTKQKRWAGLTDADSREFVFGAWSCALCVKFHEFSGECAGCPLYENGKGCINNEGNPYEQWEETGDPKPMLAALRKALKAIAKK